MELINSMNGTQNDRYLMQDPYVQGANDPMAAPPGTMSAAAGQDAMAANTAAQRNRNAAAAAQNYEWFAVQRFDRLLEMNASIAEDLEEQEAISESAAETYLTQLKWKKIYNIPTSETSANTACEKNPGY